MKQMLLDACENPELENIAEKTHGVIFFSTPHHGSSLAAASQQAKMLLYPSVEVKELVQGKSYVVECDCLFSLNMPLCFHLPDKVFVDNFWRTLYRCWSPVSPCHSLDRHFIKI